MRSSISGLAIVLAVLVAVAGCGQSAKERRQEFLVKARTVCSHFATLQNEVQFPSVNPLAASTTHAARAQWGLALDQIINYGRQQVRGLQKLKPPKDLKPRFGELIDTKTAAYDELAKGADAAKRNHRAEIEQPVSSARKKLAQASSVAKALGLASCG